MLAKHLRRAFLRFSKQKQANTSVHIANPAHNTHKHTTVTNPQQYLVFPTKFPIFPYYIYVTRINRYLYEYISKNNIRYVTACALQPGVAKSTLYPKSEAHLIQQLKLKELASATKSQKDDEEQQSFQINNNNIIFDQSTKSNEQMPVFYVDNVNKVFPVASVCRVTVFPHEQERTYRAHLRSEIRLDINTNFYENQKGPLMYVSGKTIKNENLLQIANQHRVLMEIYNKIWAISKINLPYVKQASIIKSIELLGGYLCTLSYFTPLQLYQLFKTMNLIDRMKILIDYYKEYYHILEIKWKYFNEQNTEEQDINKQKEHIREIYEHIQTLLGHKTDLEYIKKVKAKLASGRYPENIMKTIQLQLQNIQDLGEGNPEINKKKQYINLLVEYPFGIISKETFDIEKAREILDEDHYGMKKIKQRILQFIAVSKIKGQFKSKVLLLHGPPGVGKTSIVKSIAKCLNRPYGRISLGGQYDTSIMKGHRKTYIGAYPGKIFDTIYKAKAQNPVILLDQIDKIQSRQGGASLQDVIMEVLDPIQNYKFKDQYMDIEIDLSRVLFICTANELDTIFPPLLDRLERIEVTGYTTGEKKQIFRRYVQKQSMTNAGLPDQLQTRIDFTEEALHSLIEGYCKQAGIRNLVRKSNTIFYKTALKYVKNEQFDKAISPKTLKQYLGQPKFKQARLFEKVPPKGVMIGLAYNAYGGSIMYIQAAAAYIKQLTKELPDGGTNPSDPKQLPTGHFIVTGNLHSVMKESCQLAYSYAKYVTSTFFNNNFLEMNDIHLNFPQIEIGKDGPSAGVAITCTLVSLALNKPAIREIAMTGQITLSGKVSAIGGVKEKTMGAKREGITHLIFPEQNKRDVEQLDKEVREGMTFYFANHFFEVMELVFGEKITEPVEASATSSA